jgi:hypothetical protein
MKHITKSRVGDGGARVSQKICAGQKLVEQELMLAARERLHGWGRRGDAIKQRIYLTGMD